MRPSRDAGLRWLHQAKHDVDIAMGHLERGDYSDACFMAEQASQKALKAFLTAQGQRSVTIHSVARLAESCAKFDPVFSSHITPGRILDQFYIPTRYPDALAPPAVPFESYSRTQGQEALDAARAILAVVAQRLEH